MASTAVLHSASNLGSEKEKLGFASCRPTCSYVETLVNNFLASVSVRADQTFLWADFDSDVGSRCPTSYISIFGTDALFLL